MTGLLLTDHVTYGAVDGVVTATTLIASATAAGIGPRKLLAIGLATLVADSLSMAFASGESVSRDSLRTALVTALAFVGVGGVPVVVRYLAEPGMPLAVTPLPSARTAMLASAAVLFLLGLRVGAVRRAAAAAAGGEAKRRDPAAMVVGGLRLVGIGAVVTLLSIGISRLVVLVA